METGKNYYLNYRDKQSYDIPVAKQQNNLYVFKIIWNAIKKLTIEDYENNILYFEWFDINNFIEWANKNYQKDCYLMKNIIDPNNKIYGPDTCYFVPKELKTFFEQIVKNSSLGIFSYMDYTDTIKYFIIIKTIDGVKRFNNFDTEEQAYNEFKIQSEKYIKDLIFSYKNKLDSKVFDCLFNYVITKENCFIKTQLDR